jgi:hypothetical protein
MDTRRFLKHSQSQALAQFRWLGWVMLMMFVLVQTATGAGVTGERSPLEGRPFLQASADFNPETHQVTVKAHAPAAAWDFTSDIGSLDFSAKGASGLQRTYATPKGPPRESLGELCNRSPCSQQAD